MRRFAVVLHCLVCVAVEKKGAWKAWTTIFKEPTFMSKLLITTERLRIRNLKRADLPGFHRYRSNPEVTRFQGFDVFTLKEAEAFIEEQAGKSFGKAGEWVQ